MRRTRFGTTRRRVNGPTLKRERRPSAATRPSTIPAACEITARTIVTSAPWTIGAEKR
jgi:hypothetical protein